MDAIFNFHKYGFKTTAIICERASSNLSMIKVLLGCPAKAYG